MTIFMLSCGAKNNKIMTNKDKITWDIQLSGYDYTQYDKRGEIDYFKFMDEFDKFPWLEQLDKQNKIQKGCSPTLSVNNETLNLGLWVSMAGDRNDNNYLIGYVYPKEKKGFLGLGKVKTVRWLEIYATRDKRMIKDCFKLFFENDFSKLESTIRQLDEFGQMEAQN